MKKAIVEHETTTKARPAESLEREVAEAVIARLPRGWTFVCCLVSPEGRKHVCGTVHGTEEGAKLVKDISRVMEVEVWQIPEKKQPVKKRTSHPLLPGAEAR